MKIKPIKKRNCSNKKEKRGELRGNSAKKFSRQFQQIGRKIAAKIQKKKTEKDRTKKKKRKKKKEERIEPAAAATVVQQQQHQRHQQQQHRWQQQPAKEEEVVEKKKEKKELNRQQFRRQQLPATAAAAAIHSSSSLQRKKEGSRIAQSFTRIHSTSSKIKAMDEEQKARMDRMERCQIELNEKLNALLELISKRKMKIEDKEGSMHSKSEYEKMQDRGRDRGYVLNLDDPKEIEKLMSARKMNMLEERLRAIEGMDYYGAIDAASLCLVPGVVIPIKFKTPEFDKYDGTKCPVTHLTMYYRKMAPHTKDDKLLMHVFQESLIGPAARWYAKLDRDQVTTWNELARAFIVQYKHIVDMTPDRLSLQNMEKKPTEGFKEYAQRWKDMASQVHPPLTERETTMLFINTLKGQYYHRLVGNASKNFADLVLSGEVIEIAIKSGKMDEEMSGADTD